jgi:hypothetical protein
VSTQTLGCVRASAPYPRGRAVSAGMLGCVRTDASVLLPGNFITDATVHPSHGRPSGHRLTIRPSVIIRVTTLLLTFPAKASRKEEVRRTAWLSALYKKKRVRLGRGGPRGHPIGWPRPSFPWLQPSATSQIGRPVGPPRPPCGGSRAGHVDALFLKKILG